MKNLDRELFFDKTINELNKDGKGPLIKPNNEISGSFVNDRGEIIVNNNESELIETMREKAKGLLFTQLEDKPFALIQEVGKLLQELKSKEKIAGVIENCANISELRHNVLKRLEGEGIIEEKPEGYVVDLEKIRNYKYANIERNLSHKFNAYYGTKGRLNAFNQSAKFFDSGQKNTVLFYTFNNFPVISKEDYNKGIYNKKELFYFPASPEAALNPEQVKKSPDFHLETREMGRSRRGEQTLTKMGEKVDLMVSDLACVIYHPHFGNGQRDKNGDLFVTYPNGQRKKIGWYFLRDYGFKQSGKDSDKLRLTDSPYKFLKSQKGKIITDHDILRTNDFSLYLKSNEFGHHLQKITSNGYTMINNADSSSIRYYVGRKFENNPNFKAIKINDKFGAILETDKEKNKKLVSIFNLTNYDNDRLNVSKNSKGSLIKTANINISQNKSVEDALLTDDNQDKNVLIRFDKFLAVANDIKKSSGVDILPLIEAEEQWNKITTALAATSKSGMEIGDFVKKYGINNLQWFLDSDIKAEEFDKYISLGQNLKHETAKKIFDKYGEIVELAQTNIAELNDNFFAESDKKINPIEELMARGKKIVLNYSEKLAEAMIYDKDGLYIELLRELDNIKKEIVVFTAMFKTAFEEFGGIDFRDIKGLTFETKKSSGLTDDEKNQILILSDKIYAEKLELQQLLRDGLTKAFNNGEKTKWYVLEKDGRIMATMRFDETNKPDTLYAGSFMVEKEYEGSAIGKSMEKIIFDEELKENKELVAITEARGLPISHYVEKQGWIVNGIEMKQNIPFFNIVNNSSDNNEYLSRQNNFSPEKALALINKNKFLSKDGASDIFTKEYNGVPTDAELEEIQSIMVQGYAITRYLKGSQYGDRAYLVFEKIKK